MISYLSTILSNRELVCSFEVVLSLDLEANEKPWCLAIVTSHISLPRKFKGKLTNGFLANVYSLVSQKEQIKTIKERKVCCMQ